MPYPKAIACQYKTFVAIKILSYIVIIDIKHPLLVIFSSLHWITQNLICLVYLLKPGGGTVLVFLLIRMPFQGEADVVGANGVVVGIIIHFQYLIVILGLGKIGEEIEIQVGIRVGLLLLFGVGEIGVVPLVPHHAGCLVAVGLGGAEMGILKDLVLGYMIC